MFLATLFVRSAEDFSSPALIVDERKRDTKGQPTVRLQCRIITRLTVAAGQSTAAMRYSNSHTSARPIAIQRDRQKDSSDEPSL